ncbi:hypothetical protein BGW80DRAFT_1248967 [Lactifluus volemus]|nr:hypothetical protein BGW80DRAFT_1248967 [Lactifluus volemus]
MLVTKGESSTKDGDEALLHPQNDRTAIANIDRHVTRHGPVPEAPSSIHLTPQGRLCDDGTPSKRAAAIVAAEPCQLIAAEGIALILLILASVHLPMKGTGNRRREASRVTVRVEEYR